MKLLRKIQYKIFDWADTRVTKLTIWFLEHGYGACKTLDYLEFEDHPHELNAQGRCAGCQSAEVIEFLKEHINLINI